MAEITLRAIEKWDLPTIQRWRNSPEVLPNCRQYRPISLVTMEEWFKKLTEDKDYNLTNDLFIIEHKGTKIGVGGFVRIDWKNRKAELSFYVGEDTYRVKEVITESLMVLISYGLATLNLWKIYFPVYSFNPQIELYKEIMDEEYIAKSEYYYEGKFYDRHILVKYNVRPI